MHNSNIVCSEINSNPFKALFLKHLETTDTAGIAQKTKTIEDFITALETLEETAENQSTFLHWSGIFSVFSSAGVLSGLAVINPIIGAIASVSAVTSAIGVIALAMAQKQERKSVLNSLRRYKIALKSDTTVNWGALWELAGIDLFTDAMHRAADGIIGSDNRSLIRGDGKNPMAAALDCVAQRWGWTRDALIAQLQLAKAGMAVSVPALPAGKAVLQSLQPATQPAIQPAPTVLQTTIQPAALPQIPTNNWVKGFLNSTCLVWGNQGSGKSWFVRHLVQQKKDAGYRVVVFDPNSNRSEWRGVELYNSYFDIEEKMREYIDEVMGRYAEFGASEISEEEWRSQLWKDGKATTFICEEMTTYADFISDKDLLTKFVKVASTLSRKQEMPAVFITHNNTQSCLGDIKGLANLIGRMQQIQLLATTDPNTNQPIASGEALIRLDGSDQWVKVSTPKLTAKIKVFGEDIVTPRERLETILKLDYNHPNEDTVLIKSNNEEELVLSPQAQSITNWLRENRKGQQIKYKSASRDQSFINLARKFGYSTQQSMIEDLFDELLLSSIISHDPEDGSIIVL